MSALRTRTRRRLYKKLVGLYGDQCYYCARSFVGTGKRQRTLDHLFPTSRGGSNELCNLVLCCQRCNHLKGALTWVEFVQSERYRQRRLSAVEESVRPAKGRVEVLTRLDAPILVAA